MTADYASFGYLDDEPVAWCAIEPRPAYIRLTRQVTWAGRDEDKTDEGVWAITCTVTRTPYRRQGFSHQMIAAAVSACNALDRGGQAAIAFGNQARQPVDLLGRFRRRLDFDPFPNTF